MTPSLGGLLTPTNSNTITSMNQTIQVITPAFYPTKQLELLNRISGRGLSIMYRFTRNPHLFSPNMVNINLIFTNSTSEDIIDIKVGKKVMKEIRSVSVLQHCNYFRI